MARRRKVLLKIDSNESRLLELDKLLKKLKRDREISLYSILGIVVVMLAFTLNIEFGMNHCLSLLFSFCAAFLLIIPLNTIINKKDDMEIELEVERRRILKANGWDGKSPYRLI